MDVVDPRDGGAARTAPGRLGERRSSAGEDGVADLRARSERRAQQERAAESVVVLRTEAFRVVHRFDVDLAWVARLGDADMRVLAVDDGHHSAVLVAVADQVNCDIRK